MFTKIKKEFEEQIEDDLMESNSVPQGAGNSEGKAGQTLGQERKSQSSYDDEEFVGFKATSKY